MGINKIAAASLILIVALPLEATYADDALVLPRGLFRVTLDANNYLPVDKRYNPDGKVEDVAIDYNRSLNSSLFPALAPLDPFVPGLPSVGDSIVSFKYQFNILETGVQYGVTDSLTIGARLPYWWVRNKVKARVDSGPGSSANVGKNPFFACGAAVCPLFVPGTTPLSKDDVQDLLGKGLDVNGDGSKDIPGFGYKRFGSWSGNGLSDIEAGFRYQYFENTDWRMAFTGGMRFPTGRHDDIDNLTDYEFGTGAWAILFRLNNDFVVSNLWKEKSVTEGSTGIAGPGDLILNGTFRYDLVLPDRETKRIGSDVNNPVSINRERVRRDLGDIFEYEVTAKYGLLEGLNFSALYKYGTKLKDRVSGNRGFAYSSLEEETKRNEHVYILALTYSTLPLYAQKKFSIPLNASISYRNRFAGSNNFLRSQYISFGLQLYF